MSESPLTFETGSLGALLLNAKYSFALSTAKGGRGLCLIPSSHGVYVILCKTDGRIYVGSTSQPRGFRERLRQHRNKLELGKHSNKRLSAAWTIFGEHGFQCYILEETSPKDAVIREQVYLNQLRPFDPEIGFNIASSAVLANLGTIHSEASRKNMSEAYRRLPEAVKARRIAGLIKRQEKPITLELDGVLHYAESITRLCEKHGLKRNSVSALLHGVKKSHLGWTLPGTESIWFGLMDPKGMEHRFYNITKFAREHQINHAHLKDVLFKGRNNVDGWRLPTTVALCNTIRAVSVVAAPGSERSITSPSGEHFKFTNLSEFCRANHLHPGLLCSVLKGRNAHHKGWTLPKQSHDRT
jgi:group I intron endonuclease